MKRLNKALLVLLLALALPAMTPRAALAACANPTGAEGEMIYNADFHYMQFCGGTTWYKMGGGGSASQWTDVTGGLSYATGGAAVGVGTLNASAILQADSTTKGFLPPRMTTAQRTAIASPATGLVVYDTDLNSLYIKAASGWTAVGGGSTASVGFYATRANATYLVSGNYVDFDTETLDLGNNFNTTTGTFTAPVAGTYYFSWSGIGNTTDDVYHYYIYKNNANTGLKDLRLDNSGNGTDFGDGSQSALLTLAAGDTVRIYYQSNSNATSHPGYVSFSGFLLGGGGGGGSSTLAGLTDAAVSSPTDGQCLVYDNSTSKWKNGSCGSGGAGTGPAFYAHKNGTNQTGITSGAATLVTLGTEAFDTANNFASNRFTPNVAGRYTFSGNISFTGGNITGYCWSEIRKNGTAVTHHQTNVDSFSNCYTTSSVTVDMNGTTDYVELYGAGATSSGTATIAGGMDRTNFSGGLIGGGGGGSSTLAGLTDVAVGTPTNGQALVYDTATSKWKPGTVASGGGSSSVGFYAQTSTGSISSGSTAFSGYTTETFDTGSNFNATTGVFTAPVAGTYIFTGLAHANVTTGTDFYAYLSKNGSAYAYGARFPTNSATNSMSSVSTIMSLAAGDTVSLGVGTSAAGTTAFGQFGGTLVGGGGGGSSGSGTYFYAARTANQGPITGGSATKVIWDTEIADTNNEFASDKFTVVTAGKYLLTASVTSNNAIPANEIWTASIYKNGTRMFGGSHSPSGGANSANSHVSAIVNAVPGDYFEIYVTPSASGNTIYGNQGFTYFTGVALGSGSGGGGGSSQWSDVTGGLSYASGGAAVGTGTLNASAILQADSTTKGFLPPRMTTTQRNAIASPASGLVIYNTTNSAIEYYDGTTWQAAAGSEVSFRAYGATTSLPTGSWTDLVNGTEVFDTGGDNYDATTGKFTAPSAGRYVFSASFQANTTTNQSGLLVQTNDAAVNGTRVCVAWSGVQNGDIINCTGIISLSAGQVVEVLGYQNTGSTIPTSGGVNVYFSGFKVGAGGGGSSQWTDVTGGINYSGGKVGIGNATPTDNLDVAGSAIRISGSTPLWRTNNTAAAAGSQSWQIQNNDGLYFGTTTDSFGAWQNSTVLHLSRNGGVGVGGIADASAILAAASTTKGFLPPRMTTTQRNAIASPAAGLHVYDTDLKVLFFYDGTSWLPVGSGGPANVLNSASISTTMIPVAAGVLVPAGGTYDVGTLAVEKGVYMFTVYNCAGQLSYSSGAGNNLSVVGSTIISTSTNYAALNSVPYGLCGVFWTGIFKSSGTGNAYMRIGSYNSSVLNTPGPGSVSLQLTAWKISGGYDTTSGGGGGSSQWTDVTGGLSYATGGAAVGTGTLNTSAILQADSTTKGFLPPRMTTTQRLAIVSPTAGLTVYDTSFNNLFVYTGTAWSQVAANEVSFLGRGSPSALTNNSFSDVRFATQIIDNGGDNYNPTTGVFTAPSDGTYFFTSSVYIGAPSATGYVSMLIQGSAGRACFSSQPYTTAGGYSAIECSGVINMSAGQTMKVQVLQNTGSTITLDSDQLNHMFSGFKINGGGGGGSGGTTMIAGWPDVLLCTDSNGARIPMYIGFRDASNQYYSEGFAGTSGEFSLRYNPSTGAYNGQTNRDYTSCKVAISAIPAADKFSLVGGGGGGGGSSQWTTTGSDIYYDTGNVGIKTTAPTPTVALDIGNNAVSGTATILQLKGTGINTSQLSSDSNMWTILKNVSNGPIVFGTNNLERMRLDANGALSIGSTANAAASSLLDLTSTTKGFLPPRMTTAQRNAIASPATGLTVYDTDIKALFVYNGATWVSASASEVSFTANGSATSVPNGTWTDLTNWTQLSEVGGDNFNAATGKFTAPVSGTYLFTANMTTSAVGATVMIEFDSASNSSTQQICYTDSSTSTSHPADNCTGIAYLTAGQAVEMIGYQRSGGTVTTSGPRTQFAGFLITGGSAGGGSSQWTDVSGGINYAGGKVGIGTATPNSKLEVNGGRLYISSDGTDPAVITGGKGLLATYLGSSDYALLASYDTGGSAYKPLRLEGSSVLFQNASSGGVGIGATSVASSALLDLTSTTKGFLPPRMTTTQRNAIASPAAGLTVFNTSTGDLNIYTGTSWASISGSSFSADVTGGMTIAGTFTYTGSGGAIGNAGLIDNTTAPAADPGGVNTSQYFSVDFGSGVTKAIRRLTFKTAVTGGYANPVTYNFEYSDNNSTWTTVGTFLIPAGTNTLYTFDFPNAGSHRYWRGKYLSGTVGGNSWVEEIEMMELVTSGSGSSQWTDVTGGINYAGGKVGVGTTTPATALDVIGTGTMTTLNLRSVSGASAPGNSPAGGSAGQVQFNDGTGLAGSDTFIWDNTAKGLRIRPGAGKYPTAFMGNVASALSIGGGIADNEYARLTFGNIGIGNYAGIGAKITPSGSYLLLGTSNNYANGITNEAITIDPSGRVGIGITPTNAIFQVSGAQGRISTMGSPNNSFFVYADDATNTFTGSTNTVTLGSSRNGAGTLPKLRIAGQSAIEFAVDANSVRAVIDSSGRMGIGTTTPSYRLSVNGTVQFVGLTAAGGSTNGVYCIGVNGEVTSSGTSTCAVSSRRFKERIEDLTPEESLETVLALKPVSFFYKKEFAGPKTKDQQIGFIAEDTQKVDPRLVVLDDEGRPYTVRYENVTSVLAGAAQAQQTKIERLSAENDNLKGQVNELRSQVEALSKRLEALEAKVK